MNEAMSEYPAPSASDIVKMFHEELKVCYPDYDPDKLKKIIFEELQKFGWDNLGSLTGWLMYTRTILRDNIIRRLEETIKKDNKQIDESFTFHTHST